MTHQAKKRLEGTPAAAGPAQRETLRELRRIPGVGASVAMDLWELGMRGVDDLRGRDPEELYERHCEQKGMRVDRCMLYVLRCAVYYAEDGDQPEKLLWWNWTDARAAGREPFA
jgi:hypothetical protein